MLVRMKNKLIYLISVLLLMFVSLNSCSSDDEISERSNDEISEKKDTLTLISVFWLQDENGVEKYVFNEGENIVFRLDVINNGEEDVIIRHGSDFIIGNDVFHVYSSKGEDFGTPYDVISFPENTFILIPSKSKTSYFCPWHNDPNLETPLHTPYGHISYYIDKIRPLPKGDYYSQFTIRLGDDRFVTCKKTFKIE